MSRKLTADEIRRRQSEGGREAQQRRWREQAHDDMRRVRERLAVDRGMLAPTFEALAALFPKGLSGERLALLAEISRREAEGEPLRRKIAARKPLERDVPC